MNSAWTGLFSDYTLRTVALGSAILGVASGALGSLAVLRRQGLLGDAISHTALPGIAIAFLLTGSKAPMVLLTGAAIAGWIATLTIIAIVRGSRVKYDSALGLTLSVFFGLGLVLLTLIQKSPDARQAGLDKFLFGQASTLLIEDVVVMAMLASVAVISVLVLWKEFKLLCFDPDFASGLGFNVRWLDVGLTTLLVIAIVLGLQMVGVVLMSAMVIAPAAAARQWTERFGVMVGLSAFFGALAGVSGSILSSTAARLPTGPTIVLCAGLIVVVSLLFAPRRGVFSQWIVNRKRSKRFRRDAVLLNLYELAQQHPGQAHAHELAVLKAMSEIPAGTQPALESLRAGGLVLRDSAGQWMLSSAGFMEAERLLRERGKAS